MTNHDNNHTDDDGNLDELLRQLLELERRVERDMRDLEEFFEEHQRRNTE